MALFFRRIHQRFPLQRTSNNGKGFQVVIMFYIFNTLRPRQNGSHFADNTFKCIFLNENVIISVKISLKFVPKGPINNIPALVQIMAWRRPSDKPLSEAMMVSLLIFCTWPVSSEVTMGSSNLETNTVTSWLAIDRQFNIQMTTRF